MSEVRRILDVGGVLMENYAAASDREMEENYPSGVTGLYPRVAGTFAKSKVGYQRIYIPKKETP